MNSKRAAAWIQPDEPEKPKVEPKKEKLIVYPKEVEEKLEKARTHHEKKTCKFYDCDVEFEVEGAKVRVEKSKKFLTFNLRCAFCGTEMEPVSLSRTKVVDFVNETLAPFKSPQGEVQETIVVNEIKEFSRRCPNCNMKATGTLEFRIPDSLIEKAKQERFHGEIEHYFAGVLKIKTEIKGGQFPRDEYYLDKLAPRGLRYVCGACGREGFAIELQGLFKEICMYGDKAFHGEVEPHKVWKIESEFRCPSCDNEMKIQGTVELKIPQTPKELIQAYELWQHDVHLLAYGRSKPYVKPSVDFDSEIWFKEE